MIAKVQQRFVSFSQRMERPIAGRTNAGHMSPDDDSFLAQQLFSHSACKDKGRCEAARKSPTATVIIGSMSLHIARIIAMAGTHDIL